jgi:hypothetical protein
MCGFESEFGGFSVSRKVKSMWQCIAVENNGRPLRQ